MVKEMNDDGNDGEGDEMNRKCRVLFSRVRVYFISAAELFFISFVCYAISLYKKKIKKSCVAKATLSLNVCPSLRLPIMHFDARNGNTKPRYYLLLNPSNHLSQR
jgi:hypothetical protein